MYLQGLDALIVAADAEGQISVVYAHGDEPTNRLWVELWYLKSMACEAGTVMSCKQPTV